MRRTRERREQSRAAIPFGLRAWSIGTFGPEPMRSCQRPFRPTKVPKPYLAIGFVPANIEVWSPKEPACKFITRNAPHGSRSGTRSANMARLHTCGECGSFTAEDTTTGEATMSSFNWRQRALAGTLLAGLVGVAPATPATAQQQAVPDFSSGQFGWVG